MKKELSPEEIAAIKEEKRLYMRAYNVAYRQTEKYKIAEKLRNQNPKRKASVRARLQSPECKERAKAYRQTKERKVYALAHKRSPEYKAWAKEYRERPENKERQRVYMNERNKTNESFQKRKAFRETEGRKAYMRAYRKSSKGMAIDMAKHGKRKAIKKAAPLGDVKAIAEWAKEWKSLPQVSCHWCSGSFSPSQCHADHVIPLSRKGAHCLSNLVVACASCNLRKKDKHPDEWAKQINQSK